MRRACDLGAGRSVTGHAFGLHSRGAEELKDSAKRLLEDKVADFRLGEADGFKVFREVIETPGVPRTR